MDAAGIVRVAGSPFELGAGERRALKSLVGREPFLVVADPPSFHDQIGVYATPEELLRFVLGPYADMLTESLLVSAEDIIEQLAQLPFEPAMRFVAYFQRELAFTRRSRAAQLRMVRAVYGDSPIAAACAMFLRANEQGVIFSEQQLFALQRLLVLHADDRVADGLTDDEYAVLRLAMLTIPGTILAADSDLDAEPPGSLEDERWVRYFVGNGALAGHGAIKHDLARAHRMYEVIAKSSAARQHQDFCPFDEWLLERWNLSFAELQALGFSLYAGSKIGDDKGPPVAIDADYFAPTTFAERVHDAFDAIAADRDWFRSEFERSPQHPRRAAFEIQPFLRRPGLRQSDGKVIVLAPRGIQGWLSATGAYYRLFDLARDRGRAEMERFRRFNGWIQERYVRHLVYVAHPHQARRRLLAGSGRVMSEIAYRVRHGESKTSDVAIDLGPDLILVEVTAKRITVKSLVEADPAAIRDDLRMLVVENMKQLGRVIGDIFSGAVALPDVRPEDVKRVWPVIVSADGLFQAPSTWAYIQEEGGHLLDVATSGFDARIMPLVLLDLEEFEMLMGIVGEGESLVRVLEQKTSTGWVERDFKSWHSGGGTQIGSGESEFMSEELGRAFRAVTRSFALPRATG